MGHFIWSEFNLLSFQKSRNHLRRQSFDTDRVFPQSKMFYFTLLLMHMLDNAWYGLLECNGFVIKWKCIRDSFHPKAAQIRSFLKVLIEYPTHTYKISNLMEAISCYPSDRPVRNTSVGREFGSSNMVLWWCQDN